MQALLLKSCSSLYSLVRLKTTNCMELL